MDQWTPQEIDDHMAYMQMVADTLTASGGVRRGPGAAPEGTFVRSDGGGPPPVTDGPFAETKDLIAGWMVIDVDSGSAPTRRRRSCRPPRAGRQPIDEWIEVRPFITRRPGV